MVNKARFEIADELREGLLVPLLPERKAVNADLACLYPHRRYQEPKIRVFLDYMIPRCREAVAARVAASFRAA